jgi:hypothetical protein
MLPLGWSLERAGLETGDLVLASHPHGYRAQDTQRPGLLHRSWPRKV